MTIPTKHNDKANWSVPWIHQDDWQTMLTVTRNLCGRLGESRTEVMGYIDTIIALYAEIEVPLSHLCAATCPTCTEVCCTKATVWYDQRDIFFYHLATGNFPEKQVTKQSNGICCHLAECGCRLNRLERPFICTWYLCPAQNEVIRKETTDSSLNIREQIDLIKEKRKKIEVLCL